MRYEHRDFSVAELRRFVEARLKGGDDEARHANIGWQFSDHGLQSRVNKCVHLIRGISNTFELGELYVHNGQGAEPSVDLVRSLITQILTDYSNWLGLEISLKIEERFDLLERASAENQLRDELNARLGYAYSVKRLKTALDHIETARELVKNTSATKSISEDLKTECEVEIQHALLNLPQPVPAQIIGS